MFSYTPLNHAYFTDWGLQVSQKPVTPVFVQAVPLGRWFGARDLYAILNCGRGGVMPLMSTYWQRYTPNWHRYTPVKASVCPI